MIKLTNVSKVYKGISIPVVALDNINLELERKGLTFILGKSGSGKSTLLNVIGLLDEPTSGEIRYRDNNYKDLKEVEKDYIRNEEIGFVFQNFNLINEFNVYDNLSVILDLKDKEEKDERIKEILKLVELEGYESRFPQELSAGQQQRVSIARALIKKPKVILADEPTGNVDSKTAKVVLDLFKKISKDILVVIVSHNESDSLKYSDRLIELADGMIIKDLKRVDNYSNDLVIDEKVVILPHNRTLTNLELEELNKQKLDGKEIIQNSSGFIETILDREKDEKVNFKKKKMNNSLKYSRKLYKNRLATNLLTTFILGFIVSVIIIATLFFRFDMSEKYKNAISNNDVPTVLFNDNKDKANTNVNEDYLPIEQNLINSLRAKGDKVYPVYNISGTVHDGKYPKPMTSPFQSGFFGLAVVDLEYLEEVYGDENGEITYDYYNIENEYDVIVTDYWFFSYRYRGNQLSYSTLATINQVKKAYPVSIGAIIKTDFFEKYQQYLTEDFQFDIGHLTKDEFNTMQDELNYKYNIRYSINPNFINEYKKSFNKNYTSNGNRYTDFRAYSGKISKGENEFTIENYKVRYFKENYDANRVVLTLDQFNQTFGTNYKNRLDVDLEKYKEEEFQIEIQIYENDNRYYYKDTFKLHRIAQNNTDNLIHFSTKNTDVLDVLLQPYALLSPPSSSTNFLTNVKMVIC